MFDETLPNIPSHPKYIISTQKGQQNRVTSAMAAFLLIERFCKICTKMLHQNLLLFAARRQNPYRFYLNLFCKNSPLLICFLQVVSPCQSNENNN